MARKRHRRRRRAGTSEQPRREELARRRTLRLRRERFGRGVAELFELPKDVILNIPRMTILGNLQMVIENHRGLIEYSPELIRVGAGDGQIVVRGEELAVGSVFSEDLSIMGRFRQITFEYGGECADDQAGTGAEGGGR